MEMRGRVLTPQFTLEVESQEDGYLAAILVQEGEEVDTMRTPIAVVCDEESVREAFPPPRTANLRPSRPPTPATGVRRGARV
jgi:pyruvate/2-oxoglutarate dehydrogenase complex dihydrolipoamide acyltransferase (E2) component